MKHGNEFDYRCADKPGPMVTRRYPETIQLAAFREITSMLNNHGLLSQATQLMAVRLIIAFTTIAALVSINENHRRDVEKLRRDG